MYVAGKQTKREEGSASMYGKLSRSLRAENAVDIANTRVEQTQGLSSSTNDSRLGSPEVRQVVQGQRKP